ncbi:MAG: XdhC family protein [Bacteroidales bacterium]|nr:XdhC family protein [Bacteroidales bacterium]MBP9511858.1 XdhC family protein [Bacteroidales bacterium]MBP9588305.1 XdhC family protein [Bacteroidales bacterium]NMD15995.1 XdhC/CoxF family protein [Bacteroidales bacterium]
MHLRSRPCWKSHCTTRFLFDFQIFLIDERPNIFSESDQQNFHCIEGNYSEIITKLDINTNDFVVVVTHEHALDISLTAAIATLRPAYIGMTGSKSKSREARKTLQEKYYLDKELIIKIDLPIVYP